MGACYAFCVLQLYRGFHLDSDWPPRLAMILCTPICTISTRLSPPAVGFILTIYDPTSARIIQIGESLSSGSSAGWAPLGSSHYSLFMARRTYCHMAATRPIRLVKQGNRGKAVNWYFGG